MSEKQLTTIEILANAGVRPSNQRVLIYEYMARNGKDCKPSKMRGDLLEQCPTLSSTSIYNTLRCFSANNLFDNMRTSKELKVCTIVLHKVFGYVLLINDERVNLGDLNAAEFFEIHYKQ